MSMIHICIYMNIQCACSPNISIDIVKELIILLPLWKSSKWPFDFRLQGRFPRKSFCSMSRWVMKPILPTKKHAKIPWLCRPCIYWLIIFDPIDPWTPWPTWIPCNNFWCQAGGYNLMSLSKRITYPKRPTFKWKETSYGIFCWDGESKMSRFILTWNIYGC